MSHLRLDREANSEASQHQVVERAYANDLDAGRLRTGRLRFLRVIAESVGIQGPTGGVVITAAILAGIVGGGTALVQVIAAIAMGFVAYAFIIFTRTFNSAGSVYGFTGAVAGPRFGFLSVWALTLVYVNFAGGVYASTADEAQPAFASLGVHWPWQVYAIIVFVLVTMLALLDIKVSSTIILGVEGISILLVVVAAVIITAKGGYHHHALSAAPFRATGLSGSALGLGTVYAFSVFSGFEGAATLGEEAHQPRRNIPRAIWISLVAVAAYEVLVSAVIQNAFPSVKALSMSAVPLVSVTNQFVTPWFGDLINWGAVLSSFGAALALMVGASRMIFALGRDGFGPRVLKRTSAATGAPTGAIGLVAIVSFVLLFSFLWERQATTAVAVILTYGADLIIAAYFFAVVAALVLVIRTRMPWYRGATLSVGVLVLGYVAKETFVPLPTGPYRWDFFAAVASIVAGLLVPIMSPRLRAGITSSPLLRVGSRALLGPRDEPVAAERVDG
ncbi:MAG TPA: APC family permease [Acidimicrobiales bacterium]|nr:APC family permease [Acidimicrobiales bacterium]